MKLFNLKSLMAFTLLVSMSLVQGGCTDDDGPGGGGTSQCPDPVYPVTGLWTGSYTVAQNPNQPALFYSFIVYPGGELVTLSKGANGVNYYGKGSWTLNGTSFTYSLTTLPPHNIDQEGSLVYSNTGTMTLGTWDEVYNPYGLLNGTFPTMNRVN